MRSWRRFAGWHRTGLRHVHRRQPARGRVGPRHRRGRQAYLNGRTFSTQGQGFPLTAGSFDTTQNGSADVFVTKLTPAGTALAYSTFVGGTDADNGRGIALEPGCPRDCAAYVTGETRPPTCSRPARRDQTPASTPAAMDAFVFKLNGAGTALLWGGYTGGAGTDTVRRYCGGQRGECLRRRRDRLEPDDLPER